MSSEVTVPPLKKPTMTKYVILVGTKERPSTGDFFLEGNGPWYLVPVPIEFDHLRKVKLPNTNVIVGTTKAAQVYTQASDQCEVVNHHPGTKKQFPFQLLMDFYVVARINGIVYVADQEY
jgi:hypothetical protein